MNIMTKSKRHKAADKAVRAAEQNSLKIMYPASADALPVEVPVTAWIRYTGPDGKGLPNQRVHLETSEFASVYPGDVKTDQDGWATTQITFKKPGTLGTVASYKATLTAIATDTPSDSDQATLTASTSAGGPGILELDPTVIATKPGNEVIQNVIWNLVSGSYTLADGTPAPSRRVSWYLDDESGVLNPELPDLASQTWTDDDGRFCNFVRVTKGWIYGYLKVTVEGDNSAVPGGKDCATRTYPCWDGGWVNWSTLDLMRVGAPEPGSQSSLTATYTNYQNSPGGKTVSWYSAPQDATFESPTTITGNEGVSTNTVTWPTARGRYSEAIWADVVATDFARGVRVEHVGPFTSPGPLDLNVIITSPDGSVFVPGVPHAVEVTLTDYKGTPVAGRPIYWSAVPANRFVFSQPYPTTTDANGQASIQVTALGSEPVLGIATEIDAATPNWITGNVDDGWFYCSIGTPAASIAVTSTEPLPLELYKPHELVATYTADDNNSKSITWQTEPEGNFSFDPNPSTTSNDGQGRATTTITGYGPNAPIRNVTVYARTDNAELGKPVVGTTQLSFMPGTAPDPDAARIDLLSVDGNSLTAGDVHLIRATYTKLDGTPIAGQPIQWQALPGKKVTLLGTPTKTNEDGVATTGVIGDPASAPFDGKIYASTNNPATHAIDQASLPLTFQQQVNLPGSIPMQLTSLDAPPLAEEAWHPFQVTYAKDADICWVAFPSDRISFERPNPTTTNDNGISINRVKASDGGDIANAIIAAYSFNALTANYDHAEVTTSFTKPVPVSKLFGVTLDKAYAQNAFSLSLGDTTEYVECQVQALTGPGPQKLILSTNPDQAYVLMYDASGKRLPTDQETGKPYVMTDKGLATFMLASVNYTVFDLTATLDKNDAVSASLTIATNNKRNNPALPAPQSAAVVDGKLTIPSGRPAPTFKVNIPQSASVKPTDELALLLNDRLVYRGPAGVGLNGEIEVAYAALNLDNGGANSLVYVVPTRESSPLSFTASGTPQTGPDTGGASRVLPKPVVNVADNTVGATDIVEPGLRIDVEPYSGMRPNEDVITLYVYLSGEDALTSAQINNIAPLIYKVDGNSPLIGGEPVTLTLPQAYIAGYGNGQLRVDYKVVSSVGTRWSDVSTYSLNTTL